MKKFCLLLGRICLSLIFVISVAMKINHWDATTLQLASMFQVWSTRFDLTSNVFTMAVSSASFLLLLATALEALGSLSLIFNYKVKIGALLLLAFLIPVTFLMHAFWLSQTPDLDAMMFFKNIGIIGGLIILAVHGDGQKSLA